MKRFFTLMTLSPLIFILTGCGSDTAEKIGTELVAAKNDLAKVIAGITDEASAKAATPQIQAIYVKLADLGKRSAGVPDPPKNVADHLDNQVMAAEEEMRRSLTALKAKDAAAEAIVRGILSSELRKLPNP